MTTYRWANAQQIGIIAVSDNGNLTYMESGAEYDAAIAAGQIGPVVEVVTVATQSEIIVQAVSYIDQIAYALIDGIRPVRMHRIEATRLARLKDYVIVQTNAPSFLTGEAARRGVSALTCANAMISEINAMDNYLVAVEEIRTQAVLDLQATTTTAGVQAVLGQAVVTLQTLTP